MFKKVLKGLKKYEKLIGIPINDLPIRRLCITPLVEESGRKEEISYLNFKHDFTLILRITSLRMTLRCPPRDSASSKFIK